MQPKLDIQTVTRNAVRDSLQDGLMELFLGAYFLLTGLLIQADLTALFILLMFFAPVALKRMKERFTYPRIGYVKFTDEDRNVGRKVLAAVLAGAIALGLVLFLRANDDLTEILYKSVSLIPAFILAFIFITTGRRSGLLRFYVMAGLALAVTMVTPFVNLAGKMDNIALYLFVMGAILAPWGAVIFVNFLRNNPVQAEEFK
jgi:ABC-type multidrug transport system permease subunit